MSFNLWSDEDRLFIPRLGGWSINFKYIARKLRWVKPSAAERVLPNSKIEEQIPETKEDRLHRSVKRSRFEDS
ncbi:hypothetical protein KKG90_10295 [Candidatus Bipolaricaulota bacterium]|nr:hypothetical protein [Candidatus Bipolaricaulota bacterium]